MSDSRQRAVPAIHAATLGARLAAAARIGLWAAGALALEFQVVANLIH